LKGRAFRRAVKLSKLLALLVAVKEMSFSPVEAPGFSPAKQAAAANGFSHGTHGIGHQG